MVKKIYIQIFLIVTLVVISLFVFFKYFNKTDAEDNLKVIKKELIDSNENVIEDIKYVSTDKDGNEYKIEAQKGNIDRKNPDLIFLENVKAVILLQNSDYIFIESNFAKYNVKNSDTLFNSSVSIDYGDHFLKSEFLDLSFENNLVSIYDNVRYLSGISSLIADKAEIDILNKRAKIFMETPNKKVLVNNIMENGNN